MHARARSSRGGTFSGERPHEAVGKAVDGLNRLASSASSHQGRIDSPQPDRHGRRLTQRRSPGLAASACASAASSSSAATTSSLSAAANVAAGATAADLAADRQPRWCTPPPPPPPPTRALAPSSGCEGLPVVQPRSHHPSPQPRPLRRGAPVKVCAHRTKMLPLPLAVLQALAVGTGHCGQNQRVTEKGSV